MNKMLIVVMANNIISSININQILNKKISNLLKIKAKNKIKENKKLSEYQ